MNSKKSIVFVNQSSGYLMIDIINAHLPYYDEIVLLTGDLKPRSEQLNKSVKINYLTKYNRASNLKRLVSWFSFFVKSLLLLKFRYRESKIYFVSNPPFNIFSAFLLPNRSFAFLVFDIFPQSFHKVKIFKEASLLSRIWVTVNYKVYSKAAKVFTISRGMEVILSTYTTKKNLVSASLWSDSYFLKPLPKKTNIFAIKHNLTETLNCCYSGNMGITHPVEIIPEIALNLSNNSVKFCLIGDGAKKREVEDLVKKYQLTNCLVLPYQSIEVFPLSLGATDIGFVTLDELSSNLSVPSKFYSLLSVGAVVLGICNKKSELAHLIGKYRVGKVFDVSELGEICSFINELSLNKDLLNFFKENSIKAARLFTSKNSKRFIFKHV